MIPSVSAMPAASQTARIPDRNSTAVITGLALAWGGTVLLISPVSRSVGDPSRLALAFVGQALFWMLAVAVVLSVRFWERQPIRSLWLQPFRWQSIGWGLLLVGAYYAVLFPLGEWVRRSAGLPGLGAGMDQVMRFPLSYRMVAVVSAGIVEELLFRGVQRHAPGDAYRAYLACRRNRLDWILRDARAPVGMGICFGRGHQRRSCDGVLRLA
jgi:hypothetical protein